MPTAPHSLEPLEARIAPASFRWDSAGNGDWDDPNNWFNETTGLPDDDFPNAVDDVAKFTNANAAGAVVTINGINVTVGSILFDDNNTYQVTASPGRTLTLASGTEATIQVSRNFGDAAHLITAPMILASSVSITQDVVSTFTISAGISESVAGSGLSKTGSGPMVLSNPVGTPLPNTYTGPTTVAEGMVTFLKSLGVNAVGGPLIVGGFGTDAAVMVLGTNQIPDAGTVMIGGQGKVTLNISEVVGAVVIDGGTFSLGANANTVLVASSLSMTGGSVSMNVASQSLNLTGNVTATSDASGPALISGGRVGLGGVSRVFTVNEGPQTQDLEIDSLISNGGLTKSGVGTLRLGGSSGNDYAGTTTVNAGALELAKDSGNAIVGALVIGDGSGGAEADVVRLIKPSQILDAQAATVNASGLLDTNGQFESIGTVSISGGHVTTGIGGVNLNITAGLTMNAGRLTAGAGSQVLLPLSTTINATGQSIIDGLGSIGMLSTGLLFNVNNSPADVDLLVTIPITGSGNVNKNGGGTMQVDATNTYGGDTLVFGRLIVNGTIGNVLFGSSTTTLAGTGTVGNVTLNGGAIRPGTSPGVLHTGNIINGGGTPTFYFEIDGAAPGSGPGFHDQLVVTGAVDLTNVALNLTITGIFAQGDQYLLIDNDGSDAVVSAFTGWAEGTVQTIGARRYIITYTGGDGNDVVLTPEQTFFIDGDIAPGADDYFVVQRDLANPALVHVTDYSAFVNPIKTWDVSLHEFASITICGGAGDDYVYFDASNGYFNSAFANLFYDLTFVGGAGANGITLHDSGAAPLASVNFISIGAPDRGAVQTSAGFQAAFEEVAYYLDELNVTDYSVSSDSGAKETFSFGAAFAGYSRVGVEGRLSAIVSDKTQISLYGNGGGDTFNITTAGLSSPTTLAIVAGTDQLNDLNVLGTSGDDTFTLSTTSATQGAITRTGQPTVTYTGDVRLNLDGGAGADTFALPAGNFTARVVGGAGADTLGFAGGASAVTLKLDQLGLPQPIFNGALLELGDTFETIVGTDQADSFHVQASPILRVVDGGAGLDALVFDALGTNATLGSGSIVSPGFANLGFTSIENTILLNVPAKPILGAQGNTFSAPLDLAVGKGAVSLAVGDLNGDGRADFVTADSKAGTVSVALSTSTGLLLPAVQKLSGGLKPSAVVLADFDGVNGLDIAVTNSGTGTVGILLNDGTGNFGDAALVPLGKAPGVFRAGDLDGDSKIDLAAIVGGNKVAILKGNGDGTFGMATSFASGSVKTKDLVLADLDADSDLDAVVLHVGGQLAAHVNDGSGSFAMKPIAKAGAGATALALADFNGDGKLDAAVTHNVASRFVSVLLGKGDATFIPMLKVAYPLAAKASALVVADFDGDGKSDLAVANGAGGRVSILRGLGTGGFVRALDLTLEDLPPRRLGPLALGDFDGDSRNDLAVLSTASAEVSILTRA